MKAIAYTKSGLPIEDPASLIDIDLPTPIPGPRDLLVAVKAVSVNPVDTKVRRGTAVSEPRVLGWDAAGVVSEHFGPLIASNLLRAHALVESGKARGKIVLEGF